MRFTDQDIDFRKEASQRFKLLWGVFAMRGSYAMVQKRFTSVRAVLLVPLIHIPHAANAENVEIGEIQTVSFDSFPTMNEQQKEDLAKQISQMSAKEFYAAAVMT